MKKVFAAAVIAALMVGTAQARDFDNQTTCGEVLDVMSGDDPHETREATDYLDKIFATSEALHLGRGERSLFASISDEGRRLIFGLAGLECATHRDVSAVAATFIVYEKARSALLSDNVKRAPAKKRRT